MKLVLKTQLTIMRTNQMTEENIVDLTPNKYGVFRKLSENTYPQDWHAYDQAKTNEDIIFKKLIQELLLISLSDNEPNKLGRKGFSTKDKLFCMIIKVYYNADLRKTVSILKELKELHYIEKVPSFKTINNFFLDTKLAEVVDSLILASSLPLVELETTGAVDSSGFSAGRFERWVKYKWGKHEGKEKDWKKLHIFSGAKTNIIISALVTEKNVADISVVQDIIGNNTVYFNNIQEFVADKAYLSKKILTFVSELGMTPFIPFKKNNKQPKGFNAWGDMWRRFHDNKEEFMKKYHQRSNVETCFSMIKRKFGNSCHMNSLDSQINEIKVKVLCHNICILIQESFENDININFGACVEMIAKGQKVQ